MTLINKYSARKSKQMHDASLEKKKLTRNVNKISDSIVPQCTVVMVSTCEWRRFAQGAVLVVDVRGAVPGAEGRGGGQH